MLDPQSFYLPIARVMPLTRVIRERLLPRAGEATASAEQRVEPVDVVARAFVPDRPRVYNLAQMFKVSAARVPSLLLKREGETFTKGEVIARYKRSFDKPLIIQAPAPGRLLALHDGEVLLEMMPAPLEVKANIKGVVGNVSRFGVVLQAVGAIVQGVWGNGKENFGVLKVLGESREQALTGDRLDVSCLGTIVVAGGALTADGLKQAEAQQVRGVVGGSMPASLREAAKDAPFPVMITEGFGALAMLPLGFEQLRGGNGREAALRAISQTRWGAQRPELVVPMSPREAPADVETPRAYAAAAPGVEVRVCGGEAFGRTGRITEAPMQVRTFESGIRARSLEVRLGEDETLWVPVHNLEALA